MKRLFFAILMLCGVLIANPQPKAMIVFDASGSMWGQIGGKAKITIAKDALKSVVKGWNKNSELGLMAYGHRVKGDCSDIETLVPISKVDKGKIVNAVMSISPKGKTPISGSLKKAANELKYTEDKATIILISDGKETCDIDPCATAKELKKQGINFVAHVIGFNVDKKTDKQLECIANATGGEYFSAKNAKELNSAVKEVAKKVEAPKPKPVVKKPKYSLKLSASESEGGAAVKASHLIYKYDEENDNNEGEQVTNCSSSKERKCKLKIPVGKYVVFTEYNELKRHTPIEIIAGKTLEKNIVLGQTGKVKLSASEVEGGVAVKATHLIYKYNEENDNHEGEQVTNCGSSKERKCKLKIPVGKYVVFTEYNELKRHTPIEIIAGKTLEKNIVLGQTGKIKLSASESEGGVAVKATHLIYKYDEENDNNEGEQVTNCSSSKERKCKLKIPVGKYVVYTEYNELKKHTPIEIVAGKTLEKNIVMKQDEPAKEDLIKADSQASGDMVQKTKVDKEKLVSTDKKSIESSVKKDIDIKELGALFSGMAQGGAKSKMLMAYKASISKALPYIQELPKCYKNSKTLKDATKCDNFANKGLDVAAKVMSSRIGITPKKPRLIAHSNWNDEIREKEYVQALQDLEKAKLTIKCIDAGATTNNLQKCILNRGEVAKSTNKMEQFENAIKMLGNISQ